MALGPAKRPLPGFEEMEQQHGRVGELDDMASSLPRVGGWVGGVWSTGWCAAGLCPAPSPF